MTIWAFGDSYIADYIDHESWKNEQIERNIKPWIKAVGEYINQPVINFGMCGSSSDYVYYKFNEVRKNIQYNDIVIVGITSLFRRWIIKEYPDITILTDTRSKLFELGGKSIKQYMIYLDHQKIHEIYCLNFLYNLDNITRKKNLHTIVLPIMYEEDRILSKYKNQFTNFHWASYALTDVNNNEYTEEFWNKIKDTFLSDGKINHLTWSNHAILTNKIINNIQNKIPIDVKEGFVKNIITADSTKNPEFLSKEFADNPIYNI